ncbi:hypothetical protein BG006_005229 [Podila minutissima]|uniref:Uncharacterized protein n=1 Tax=Podila minutissima TaxID=64525 RepID=A0A9P5SP94_9FUNG|nr:hypothetical protein BG006_005229 [Podila minutissima]
MRCKDPAELDDDDGGPRAIPAEILRTQSRHFRYVSIWHPLPIPLQCTHIKELYLQGEGFLSHADLIFSNSQLSNLMLDFGDGQRYSDVQHALEAVRQLKVFCLRNLLFKTPDQVTQVLNNNSASLQELDFHIPYGISGFLGCEPLTRVRRIGFSGSWTSNMGMLELIRLCPNLEILKVSGRECPVPQLAKSIRECCPKVAIIRCDLGGLSEDESMLLVQAPSRLVELDSILHSFSTRICDALLMRHASWLERLNLSFFDGAKAAMEGTNRILASCPNLRSLAMFFAGSCSSQEYAPSLWANNDPWICTQLETLDLNGCFFEDLSSGSADDVCRSQKEAEAEAKFRDDLSSHGWSVSATPPPGAMAGFRLLSVVRRYEILRRVWDMECAFRR